MLQDKRYAIEVVLSLLVVIIGFYVPYVYYFNSSGPFSFMNWMILILFCFGVTFNTFLNLLDKKWTGKRKYIPLLICVLGTSLSFSVFYLEQETFEQIDWKINYYNRIEVVDEVLKMELDPNYKGIKKVKSFIPISNGGNEVGITKCEEGVTIKFWIDRGLLDTHSEFIYSNCKEDILKIKKIIKENKDKQLYYQIQKNWFRLNNYD